MTQWLSRVAWYWVLGIVMFFVIGYGGYRWVQSHEKEGDIPFSTGVHEQAMESSENRTKAGQDARKIESGEPQDRGKVDEHDLTAVDSANEALKDTNVAVRMEAVLTFRSMKEPSQERVALLARFLDDPDDAVIAEAIDTLGYIGENSELADVVFEILEKKARDKSFEGHRGEALLVAGAIGKEKLFPIMRELLAEHNEGMNDFVARTLAVIESPECVPYLEMLLSQSKESKVRGNVFDLLARIASPSSLAILDKYAASEDGGDQAVGVQALARTNLPEINEKLADNLLQGNLQNDTIRAIARSAAAPDVFGRALQSGASDDKQRLAWLKALDESATIGPAERRKDLSKAVSELLSDPNPDIQIAAINVIAKGGDPESDEILASALESPNEQVRKAGMDALIGYVRPNKYKNLFQYMWDDNESVRREAFMMASVFADESDREEFVKLEKHADPIIAKHSKQYLENLKKKQSDGESEKQVNP